MNWLSCFKMVLCFVCLGPTKIRYIITLGLDSYMVRSLILLLFSYTSILVILVCFDTL